MNTVDNMPPELDQAFVIDPGLRDYFETLAPSHQKEYAEWVASAKDSETRARRAQKVIEQLRKKPKA
jgi:uncharacterized protein YdeI (YjbR/CyaY-like superfamily)